MIHPDSLLLYIINKLLIVPIEEQIYLANYAETQKLFYIYLWFKSLNFPMLTKEIRKKNNKNLVKKNKKKLKSSFRVND